MKFLIVSILVLNLAIDVFGSDSQWEEFRAKYHKKSTRSKSELAKRKEIFDETLKKIEEHNSNSENSFRIGVNKFADWTEEEKKAMLMPADMPKPEIETMLKPLKPGQKTMMQARSDEKIPDAWDWRDHGKVSPIRDQNPCGSCWAFGTTAAIEAMLLIQYNVSYDLSEQMLVDCVDQKYGRPEATCAYGGWPAWAYKFIMDNEGYALEDQYPYVKQTQECKLDPSFRYAGLSGFVKIPAGDEEEMKRVLYLNGPITVNIDANGLYNMVDGIFDTTECAQYGNHIVTVVGYGTQNGRDFWVIKNSWSEGWGEKGFAKIARGKNMCGVANFADYPVRYL